MGSRPCSDLRIDHISSLISRRFTAVYPHGSELDGFCGREVESYWTARRSAEPGASAKNAKNASRAGFKDQTRSTEANGRRLQ